MPPVASSARLVRQQRGATRWPVPKHLFCIYKTAYLGLFCLFRVLKAVAHPPTTRRRPSRRRRGLRKQRPDNIRRIFLRNMGSRFAKQRHSIGLRVLEVNANEAVSKLLIVDAVRDFVHPFIKKRGGSRAPTNTAVPHQESSRLQHPSLVPVHIV